MTTFDSAERERLRTVEADHSGLTRVIDAARVGGDSWRELLSATGEELVEAVRTALLSLEFGVVDSDGLPEHKGKKREDLRVHDGSRTALVEVKGYAGAAKSNDIQQVSAASAIYAAAEGRVPDVLWYVVNTYRDADPSQRAQALQGREMMSGRSQTATTAWSSTPETFFFFDSASRSARWTRPMREKCSRRFREGSPLDAHCEGRR